jgi:hypothetical protein
VSTETGVVGASLSSIALGYAARSSWTLPARERRVMVISTGTEKKRVEKARLETSPFSKNGMAAT